MKKIISMMMVAVVAMMAVSCDSDDSNGGGGSGDEYGVTGVKYVGTLNVSTPDNSYSSDQPDIVFYADESENVIDILMPGVSFMPELMPELNMAFLSIPYDETDDYYYAASAEMYGIYDHQPLLNDVIQSISEVKTTIVGSKITIKFVCTVDTSVYDGDVNITYEGETTDSAFSMSNPDGFYVTTSKGDVYLADATVTYYTSDNTIIIKEFTYSTALSTTTLPIIGLTSTYKNGKTTLDGSDIETNYIFMTYGAVSVVNDLKCEVIEGVSQLSFTIVYNSTEYPCTYSGDITIVDSSYEGMYIGTTTPSLLSDITVTYYETDQALVIDNFAYSAAMQPYQKGVLPIVGVTAEDGTNVVKISGDEIDVTSTVATYPVKNLSGTIINGTKAQFSFEIDAASGGSGVASTYTCTYNGNVTISNGSYGIN